MYPAAVQKLRGHQGLEFARAEQVKGHQTPSGIEGRQGVAGRGRITDQADQRICDKGRPVRRIMITYRKHVSSMVEQSPRRPSPCKAISYSSSSAVRAKRISRRTILRTFRVILCPKTPCNSSRITCAIISRRTSSSRTLSSSPRPKAAPR